MLPSFVTAQKFSRHSNWIQNYEGVVSEEADHPWERVNADRNIEFFHGVKAKPDHFGPCPADAGHEYCVVAFWNVWENSI